MALGREAGFMVRDYCMNPADCRLGHLVKKPKDALLVIVALIQQVVHLIISLGGNRALIL
jgi:hypothetical protein